jgi:hypothetical protein
MPTNTALDAQINDRITAFVDDISKLVRIAALEAVVGALGGEVPVPLRGMMTTSSRNGRRRGARRGPRAATARGAARGSRRGRGGRRARRTAAEVEAVAGQLRQAVSANPGLRIGELAKVIGVETKDAGGPIRMLMDAKAIRSEGVRGGTRYFPAGRGGGGRRSSAGARARGTRRGRARRGGTRKGKTAKRKTRKTRKGTRAASAAA